MYTVDLSDSDDSDYNGFSFGDEFDKKIKPKVVYQQIFDEEDKIYTAILNGDLEEFKQELTTFGKNKIDKPLKHGLTILQCACLNAQVDIAEYALNELNADPNIQVDSITPLMNVCCCKEQKGPEILKIINLLLNKGAVLDIPNKYGLTPFLMACINGHADAVKFLYNKVNLNVTDNEGYSALFYAIENNHVEVTKILIYDAGLDVDDSVNEFNQSPRQLAELKNLKEILNIMPVEKYKYHIPASYLSNSSERDLAPRVFRNDENHEQSQCDDDVIENTIKPEYFNEIDNILVESKLNKHLEMFAKHQTTLSEFLTTNDDKLKSMGVKYEITRKKILLGVWNYHRSHWLEDPIAIPLGKEKETSRDNFMFLANHLKNLIIINSTVIYIEQNLKDGYFGSVYPCVLSKLEEIVQKYSETLKDSKICYKKVTPYFLKKSPLFIGDYISTTKSTNTKISFTTPIIFAALLISFCYSIKKKFD